MKFAETLKRIAKINREPIDKKIRERSDVKLSNIRNKCIARANEGGFLYFCWLSNDSREKDETIDIKYIIEKLMNDGLSVFLDEDGRFYIRWDGEVCTGQENLEDFYL